MIDLSPVRVRLLLFKVRLELRLFCLSCGPCGVLLLPVDDTGLLKSTTSRIRPWLSSSRQHRSKSATLLPPDDRHVMCVKMSVCVVVSRSRWPTSSPRIPPRSDPMTGEAQRLNQRRRGDARAERKKTLEDRRDATGGRPQAGPHRRPRLRPRRGGARASTLPRQQCLLAHRLNQAIIYHEGASPHGSARATSRRGGPRACSCGR